MTIDRRFRGLLPIFFTPFFVMNILFELAFRYSSQGSENPEMYGQLRAHACMRPLLSHGSESFIDRFDTSVLQHRACMSVMQLQILTPCGKGETLNPV
jgi:hypothetical protein